MSGSVPGFEISMTISDGTKLIFQCTSTGALYATKKDGKQNLVWKIQPQLSLSRFDDIVVSSGIGSVGFSWKRLPNEYRLYFHVDGIKVAYLTATFPEQRLSLSRLNFRHDGRVRIIWVDPGKDPEHQAGLYAIIDEQLWCLLRAL